MASGLVPKTRRGLIGFTVLPFLSWEPQSFLNSIIIAQPARLGKETVKGEGDFQKFKLRFGAKHDAFVTERLYNKNEILYAGRGED